MLLYLPPETLLYICEWGVECPRHVELIGSYMYPVSFLDVPDLACLAEACPELQPLIEDPVLRRERLLVVAPSRVSHSLFGTSTAGLPLRPTLPDLIHRGIMRGMGIERRWRDGLYFSSAPVRPCTA